jgi:hypothetical protein
MMFCLSVEATAKLTLAITWPQDEFGIDKLIAGGGSGEWLC